MPNVATRQGLFFYSYISLGDIKRMLKKTLFVAISLCAISRLGAGCFPGYFFNENGAASPKFINPTPYYADFPGAQFAGSPKNGQAERRLSKVVMMMTAVTLASPNDTEKKKTESKTVEVQG